MAAPIVVEGLLASVVERPYGSFTDRQTGEQRPGGVTYRVYVVEAFDAEPAEVQVRSGVDGAAMLGELRGSGQGSRVELECAVNARQRGNGAVVVYQLQAILKADGKSAEGEPF